MSALLNSAVLLAFGILAPPLVNSQTPPRQTSEAQLIERVQALIAGGRLMEADQNLIQAIRLYPRSGGLYNLVGIVAAERNLNRDAESAFTQAVQYSPALVPAYLNLARVQYGEGKQRAAIETYRRALHLDNSLEEAHANLSALLLSQASYADAQLQLADLPASVRAQNGFLAMQCAALAGSGHLDQARHALAQMRAPFTEQDVSLSAFTLAKLGQNSLLIQLVEPALNNGASKELRGLLATAYAQTSKLPQARVIFDSILRENPEGEQVLIDAAHVAYRQNDFEASASYLIRALRLDKQNPQLEFFFGIVCIELNLPGDSVQALKEAVRLDPQNAPFNYALGAAILSGEKSGNAALYFKKYIQLRPADPHGRFALGVAEFEAQDKQAARRDLLPLTRDPSVSAGAHYILGKICREENDYDGAREHFAVALRTDTRNPDLEANLALVDIRQNKLAEARQALDKALTLDPDNFLANEGLLLLLRREKDPNAEGQARKFAAVTQKVSDEQRLLLRHIDIQPQTN